MRSQRVITTAAFLALAVPATAHGSSLLSGYGGPGQGSQAILGATVIGGSAGGGGTAGGGSSAGSGSSSANGLVLSSTPSAPPAKRTQSGSRAKAHRSGASSKRPDRTSTSPANAYRATSTLSSSETASVSTPALGISGANLVYILMACGALALTGAIKGRLARRSH